MSERDGDRMVKARKSHTCELCGREVKPGEVYELVEGRAPRLDDWREQVGIQYFRVCLCQKPDCEDVYKSAHGMKKCAGCGTWYDPEIVTEECPHIHTFSFGPDELF